MQLPFSNLQVRHQNPGASMPLVLPVQVVCNTSDEIINENIRVNSRRGSRWLASLPAHDGVAVLCGNGPSLKEDVEKVRALAIEGATVFALNGACRFLNERHIMPRYQVILDAQWQTAKLIGTAHEHLFASQVDPECFRRAPDATLWHLQIEGIDDLLPEYDHPFALIGAASSVGTTSLVLAYALGFRTIKCFGYDSSHADGKSHAERQPMNDGEPICSVTFNGRDYRTSLTMKLQAERFPLTARLLEREGVSVEVFGAGLLPDIWNAPVEVLSEKEKYERMWALPNYRVGAPGAEEVERFLGLITPGTVLDFGAGTGRAALKLAKAGCEVVMIDFAANARDPEALHLPFIEHDLTEPIACRADYGFCCDVMEHIPPADVRRVLDNIFEATPRVYFRIDTKPDICGMLINQDLHLSLLTHGEWRTMLSEYGGVPLEQAYDEHSVFYVVRNDGRIPADPVS